MANGFFNPYELIESYKPMIDTTDYTKSGISDTAVATNLQKGRVKRQFEDIKNVL